MHTGRTRAILCLAFLLGCRSSASALNPQAVSQYSHTAWTIREGALDSSVMTIAQTPDGYLWLGTESGLLRFDGVRFVRWQPRRDERLPSTSIAKLLVARDGRLWIGTSAGLASLKDGHLVTYPEFAGVVVPSLVEDSQSTIWAGTLSVPTARLCAIRSTVECVGQDGRFGVGVFSLLADAGSLWVGAASGLWRWAPGEPRRYSTAAPNVGGLLKLRDDSLLIATSDGLMQLVGDTLRPYPLQGIDRATGASRLFADRDWSIWIGPRSKGLVHLHNGQTDTFTRTEGLSGEQVQAIFEDGEGTVWVGTNEGLDRFRESSVTVLPGSQGMPVGLVSSVLRARDESVWVGSADGLFRWKDGRATVYRTRQGLPDARIGTLFEDTAGRIFVATFGGIAVFERGAFATMRSVSTRIVYGIVEERPGELWIADQEHGLLHLLRQEVVGRTPWSAFGRDDHATALVFDRTRAGLWLGFYKGGVAFLKNGAIGASYGTADGLAAGRVAQLQIDSNGALWATTATGMTRINDGHVATLTTRNGLPCEGVHWTIADVVGALWLSTPCGLVRISSSDLTAWIADPNRSLMTKVLDASDGFRSTPTPIGFNPPAVRLVDGQIWFAGASGVGAVDPGRLPFNSLAPAVHVEELVADRHAVAIPAGDLRVALPALTRDLRIDYTALSLIAPEKVRFRYLLEGYEREWQDAGNRRQAFYSNLPPRSYRFRVTASNNDGVWNNVGASIDFSVAPAYYQTKWFLALSIAALIALVWGGHRGRLHIVRKHEREISALNERLMKAQEQERIRIAGELHDGVMQEMLAVTMMLGTAKRRIPDDSQAKVTIEKAQEKLIQAGTDLRQLSHDLHPPLLQEAGLPKAVLAYCEQFAAASGIPIACEAAEDVRDLSRGAALALFRIVQEALGNAAKHAAAKQISLRLWRADGMVSLTISDDGVGIDSSRFSNGGGLGMVMMRERATQLDGWFEFESTPGRGTAIRVAIPFR